MSLLALPSELTSDQSAQVILEPPSASTQHNIKPGAVLHQQLLPFAADRWQGSRLAQQVAEDGWRILGAS